MSIILTVIGGGVFQQLEADYIKRGNRYRQSYYAYGEPLIEPEVLLPQEIVWTWEAEGTDITRVIREDGTGTKLDSYLYTD